MSQSLQSFSHIQQPEEAKSTTAERQPLLPGQVTKLLSCLPKYKLRKFSSKGALLVLFWNFAVWFRFGSPVVIDNVYRYVGDVSYYTDLPVLILLAVAVLSGWLADIYLGRHKVVRAGLVLVWIGQLTVCIRVSLEEYLGPGHPEEVVHTVLLWAYYVLWYSGSAAVLVNSVQLGIDQMPEASAEEITSFIHWFVLILHSAIYTGIVLKDYVESLYVQLGFCVLLTLVLVSDFLLSETWIIDLPGSGNPFKGVYRVLKYAWKHKFPVQRSAFTYWEDEIPSRMDFGKEKYGGPFTTEQVEDVKTIFRILLLTLPAAGIIFCMALSQGIFEYVDVRNVTFHNFTNMSTQHQTILFELVASQNVWVIILLLIVEFIVYPLARNWIPSMLKRIGIAVFTVLPFSLIFLVINIIAYIHGANINIFWLQLSTYILGAIRIMLLTTTVLEFICAQSPLAVKGFLIGCIWSLYALSVTIAKLFFLIWHKECSNKSDNNVCGISYYTFSLVIGSIGFIGYCLLARWYKKRKRDETSYRHALVEEVYERYISAAAANEQSNGIS